jgi:tetratricopeptide (TPR) repeat protein
MKQYTLLTFLAAGLFSLFTSCNDHAEEKAITLNNEGIAMNERTNFSGALLKFREAIGFARTAETKANTYRNLSVTFYNLNELDSSKHYSQLGYQAADKNSYYYYVNKAEYDLLSNKTAEAIQLLEKAKDERDEMEIYNNLSLIYSGEYGEDFVDLNKALKNAKKAFELDSAPALEEQLAGIYFMQDNYKKSLEHYSALMKRYPEIQLYKFFTGQAMLFAGDEDKGLELMEEAAARDDECRKMLDEFVEYEEE